MIWVFWVLIAWAVGLVFTGAPLWLSLGMFILAGCAAIGRAKRKIDRDSTR
jgi:hypothetical protein